MTGVPGTGQGRTHDPVLCRPMPDPYITTIGYGADVVHNVLDASKRPVRIEYIRDDGS